MSTQTTASSTTTQKAARTADKAADTASAATETLNNAMKEAGNGFWQRMMAFNGEAARLAAVRADHYREYFNELACCTSPVDASQVTTRAAQQAVQDYVDDFGRLSQIAMAGAAQDKPTRSTKD